MDNAAIVSGITVSGSTSAFIFLGHIIGFSPIISTPNSEVVLSERMNQKKLNKLKIIIIFNAQCILTFYTYNL